MALDVCGLYTRLLSKSTASSDLRWPLAIYNGAICQQPRWYYVRIDSSLRIAQLQK